MGKYLSCGKLNNYYKYIFLAAAFSLISTIITGIGYCNNANVIYIAHLYPEETEKTQIALSYHIIIHNIYRYIIILIISIFLFKYEKSHSQSQKEKNKENFAMKIKFLYQKDIEEIKQKSKLFIIFGIVLYFVQDILSVFYFQFDLRQLDLWILELPLLSFFSCKLLKVKIYGHHKFSIYLSVFVGLISKIIEIFIYLFSDDFKDQIYNKHKFLFFIGIFTFLIIIILRAYSLTEMKVFMDYKFVSPTKLLIYISIIGIIINFFLMFIFTYNKCKTIDDIDIHLCNIGENDNREEAYLENYYIYFQILNDSINNGRAYEVFIEIFTSIIGSLTFFGFKYFFILIIKYLSSVHYIFYGCIHAFAVRILSTIILLINNSYFNELSFNTGIFIATIISDIVSTIAICIYSEVIELNFCKLDLNLRKNIISRSNLESDDYYNIIDKSESTENSFDEENEENNSLN